MKPFLAALIIGFSTVHAQDVLFLRNGEKRAGQIVSVDANMYRLQVPLPTPPGSQAPAAFASVSVPRADVEAIQFAPDTSLDQLLRAPTPAQITDLRARWARAVSWLGIPKSPAAQIGNALANTLLKSGNVADATQALELFTKIESEAWNADDQLAARQGRLRAMVATGNAKDAVKEAEELAKITEDPAVLIEAKYILAEAASTTLRKLLEENPRWEEDINVIPERNRLYHESIDLYLYPSLFEGSETDPSARGLWGAVEVYKMVAEPLNALECARDITVIYPGTKYAALAKEFIASLPADQQAVDPEKEAKADQLPGSEESSTEKTEKKSHETKDPKTS